MSRKKEHMFSVTIKDCDVQTFCSGGPGGQHQNKTHSGVRIVHRESGAVGECREERSQHANKIKAFKKMASSQKFKLWVQRKAFDTMEEETVEEKVEKMMQPENIKVEVKRDGRWVDELQQKGVVE